VSERERRIRERAEQLWREAGQPEHQDERFWLAAEQDIDALDVSAGAVQPRPPTEPIREERVPGRIEPPIQKDDPAGPPVGTPRVPRR
jgi:Protein of unknown function (DUF2934)